MTEWITDRQPTEADGDPNGKVLVPNGEQMAKEGLLYLIALPWQRVPNGAPWRRMMIWQPPVPAAEPAPAAKPTPTTLQSRRFVSISHTVAGADSVLDAVADDGTAWWRWSEDDQWRQHPPLPTREVPADA